jgi:hypothetical protein
MRKVAVYVM